MDNLELNLQLLCLFLSQENRWKGTTAEGQESVLDHTFKQAFITQIMLAYEMRDGNPHELDIFLFLQAAINHDIAEAFVGDIPKPDKTDENDLEEDQMFSNIIATMIPLEIQPFFPQPPDRNKKIRPVDRVFWQVCETVGYLLFAWEKTRNGDKHFESIFRLHLEELKKQSTVFHSAREIARTFDYYYEKYDEEKTSG